MNYEQTKSLLLNNLTDLDKYTSKVVFRPGQIIYYKGHIPYGIYILTEGMIEIDYTKYSEKVEAVNTFGINSFINNSCYSGTAKAISTCTVSFLSKSQYNELVNHSVVNS